MLIRPSPTSSKAARAGQRLLPLTLTIRFESGHSLVDIPDRWAAENEATRLAVEHGPRLLRWHINRNKCRHSITFTLRYFTAEAREEPIF